MKVARGSWFLQVKRGKHSFKPHVQCGGAVGCIRHGRAQYRHDSQSIKLFSLKKKTTNKLKLTFNNLSELETEKLKQSNVFK